MKEKTVETIFNQQLAGFLMGSGFVLLGTESNYFNPKFNVFFFKKSEELERAIISYKERRR